MSATSENIEPTYKQLIERVYKNNFADWSVATKKEGHFYKEL